MATTNIWLNFGINTPQNPKFDKLKPIKASSFDFPLASKIMVRNLSYSTTESCLEKEFSNFGTIAEVKIVKDEVRKRSKGYAFIQYSSQEAALQALENMDQKYVDGRLIYVELAKLDKRSYYRPPITSGPPTGQMTSTLQEEES
ncbi:organelle RRM domain-containing protein 6, chloroplastic [Apium graveolens]|uniref:organelle RRM domain-containing protein 6, chloroplastic n=1 Tax=Apium graveolens TaxID=4045 RepID=UPI003D7BBF6E